VSFAAKHHQRFTTLWMDNNDHVIRVDILHHQVHGGSIGMSF
jgi:hypothetical protein